MPDDSQRPLVIAIDGPSGSGKSSVSREVARRLALAYLDTGAMYRAACWACQRAGVDLDDPAAVAARVAAVEIGIALDPDCPEVLVDGVDVTSAIRETSVSAAVSRVAANTSVREQLRAQQRRLLADAAAGPWGGCVAEGRDITTVVAPDADVRILLTADERARLARRAREVHGSVDAEALDATRDQVLRRDADDARVTSFLEAADGVIAIDSSALDFEQTVAAVLDTVARFLGESPEALMLERSAASAR